LGKNAVPVPFVHHKPHVDDPWTAARVFLVRSWQPTTSAMAQPYLDVNRITFYTMYEVFVQ